jgi:hypothetical protein
LYLHWVLLISLGAITVWPVISCLFPSHHTDVKTQWHSHILAISKKFFIGKTTKFILKILHIWPDVPHSAWISDCERVNKNSHQDANTKSSCSLIQLQRGNKELRSKSFIYQLMHNRVASKEY